jgi:hypothetical protein
MHKSTGVLLWADGGCGVHAATRHGWFDQFGIAIIAGQAAWPVEDGQGSIGILMYPDGRTDIVMAVRLLRDLQGVSDFLCVRRFQSHPPLGK